MFFALISFFKISGENSTINRKLLIKICLGTTASLSHVAFQGNEKAVCRVKSATQWLVHGDPETETATSHQFFSGIE